LKQFFRDLPDPLLTSEHHDSFIAAASKFIACSSHALATLIILTSLEHDDETVRRDSLHAIINNLPDPNYATLRAISLHLYRVIENSHVNRMNSHNLAVIFGPTLMGSDPSTAIADAGWQIKVIDTILQNTYQIFDED
jgi:Rho GTPase-activating protein RGD1